MRSKDRLKHNYLFLSILKTVKAIVAADYFILLYPDFRAAADVKTDSSTP